MDNFSIFNIRRKAIGIELKDSYFKQAKINLDLASSRFQDEPKQMSILD